MSFDRELIELSDGSRELIEISSGFAEIIEVESSQIEIIEVGTQGPPGSGSFQSVGVLRTWTASVDGQQDIAVSTTVQTVPYVAINGLIQPQNSFAFSSSIITFPANLNVMAGDRYSAFLVG